jgi:DNA processing protein
MFDPAFVDWNLPATACPPEERHLKAPAHLARQLARLERMGLGQPFVMRPSALGLHWFPAGHWLVGCGNAEVLHQPSLAVVGTRSPAAEEEAALRGWLDESLQRLGLTVVSGGARGIDTMAHRAALRARLPTVAVLAGGMLQAGPAQNRSLFAEIVAAGGCILTEQPLGCRPFDTLFVARNRTIAALSLGTLVVRAPVQSGALTTAGFARRLQRPVGVLPGAPWEPSAAGSNGLLMRGAAVVTQAEELAVLLGTALSEGSRALPLAPPAAQRVAVPSVGLSEAASRLWALLSVTWEEGDDVVRLSGLAGGEAVAALTELELDGLLERRGTQWRRARR